MQLTKPPSTGRGRKSGVDTTPGADGQTPAARSKHDNARLDVLNSKHNQMPFFHISPLSSIEIHKILLPSFPRCRIHLDNIDGPYRRGSHAQGREKALGAPELFIRVAPGVLNL
ncbi:hypothetical protein P8C59_006348 [Phyllachora maydis]|uniref:Uncharacterized protein n=1 Tax=Phyllachora maydis TaxID=1825666 RepID=A0AAD9I821_9PEZI|nr:hypothetical protein P8C59_006348 [Phyllachora maydis]